MRSVTWSRWLSTCHSALSSEAGAFVLNDCDSHGSPGVILGMLGLLFVCLRPFLKKRGRRAGKKGGRWPLCHVGSQIRGEERTGQDSFSPRALPTLLAPVWG